MHDTLIQFGQRYRRYMLTFGPLARHCPAPFWPALQSTLGRWLNPHYARKARICRALSTVTDNITPAWNAWLDSHSRFVYDLLRYASMTPRWVSDNVHIAEPERFAELCAQGGLLLTYHTHHQNTIGCVFGLSGCKSSTLAAAPENSPLFPLIGRWAQQLNRESAQHFGGGDYLFINHLRQLSAACKQAFAERALIVCMADFNQAAPDALTLPLFNRLITPPTGAIKLALRHKAPIHTAIFAPEGRKFVLHLHPLDSRGGLEGVLRGYLRFLEHGCRHNPACWQGWDWFGELPENPDAATAPMPSRKTDEP